MSTKMSEIDALLQKQKQIFNDPEWIEDGNTAKLKATLMEGGIVIGELFLDFSCTTHINPQRGDCIFIRDGKVIQRLAFRPKNTHCNPNSFPAPSNLRLKSLPPGTSRIYRWRDNRAWPPSSMMAADIVIPEPTDFSEAISVFLFECGVSGHIPTAPLRLTLL